MNRSRAFFKALLAFCLLLGVLLVLSQVCRRLRKDPAELSKAAWTSLKEKMLRRAGVSKPTVQPAPPAVKPPEPVPLTRPALPEPNPELLASQAEKYSERSAKTVIELQQFRRSESVEIRDEERSGIATLINLNPTVNTWYLLAVKWSDGTEEGYHLSNSRPETQDLQLDRSFPHGLIIVDSRRREPCDLWSADSALQINLAATSPSPYVGLCGGEVSLRLKTKGHRTNLEWTTDFLRDHVWGGEKITTLVREMFFQDAFLNTAEIISAEDAESPGSPNNGVGFPSAARLDPECIDCLVKPKDLGILLDNQGQEDVVVGRWYRALENRGVFVSVIQPQLVAPEILKSHLDIVSRLDEIEREALVFLVAFDLDQFDIGFALGTDHPRVDWSERVASSIRDETLPGPDGIGDIEPLVATGIIPSVLADRTVATFTGGFKRGHGAFKTGRPAFENYGSHYGFIENGVVLSKLQPDLATLFVLADGRLEMKTWTQDDNALLPKIKFARQNGVPLIEYETQSGSSVPGDLVNKWALGNWSGSQDQRFRTLRAGAALQETGKKRFLIYGYFSTATPSAMARVFQAYACKYAMLLDMNALEHTYLALYHIRDSKLEIQHLERGMSVLDKPVDGQILPRFLGFADNRDFFYLMRRQNGVNPPR